MAMATRTFMMMAMMTKIAVMMIAIRLDNGMVMMIFIHTDKHNWPNNKTIMPRNHPDSLHGVCKAH
eukprot:4107539-Lingulodinium_polyedra.AAC.1